ncbi:MAG: hypothetical protein LC754_02870 [Acidobacteria bacterium]|nr:hypothetical protein [Acidobacteriota bacterium]
MKRNIYASPAALLVVLAMLATPLVAQTRRKGNAVPAQTPGVVRAFVPLPASDAVVVVNLRRLLTEAVPRALGGDAAQAAQVNADIERFKAQTGIDARQFDTLSAGVRFSNPSPHVTKIGHLVAVAHGTFNPGALVAAGRLASKGSYTQQQYGGKDVYVFSLNDQVKVFGLLKLRVRDLAMSALDANTLAVGETEAVRAAIDAQAGKGRVDEALLSMATNPNNLVGFAGNVPASALGDVDLGNPELTRSISSIRQLYGSIGMTGTGFQLLTALRTLTAQDAKSLGDTVAALKQFAPALINISGAKGKLAKNAIESLTVTTQGNEVQLRLELSPGDIATLRTVF